MSNKGAWIIGIVFFAFLSTGWLCDNQEQPSGQAASAMIAVLPNATTGGVPIGAVPTDGAQVSDAPVGDVPTGGAPVSDAPVGDVPTASAPVSGAPAGDASAGDAPANAPPVGGAKEEKSVVEEVYDAVPDGGSISRDDFAKKVRKEVADLVKLAKVTSLSRKGNHFVLDCQPGTVYSSQGIDIVVGKQLEFDVVKGKDSAKFSGINGVSAVLPQGLGSARLLDTTIELDKKTGNITVSGNVRIDSWSLTLPFNFTIKPEAKP